MSSAKNRTYTAPGAADGAAPVTDATTAWVFGAWVDLTSGHPYNIAISGFSFQHPSPASAVDTTDQVLFEIGSGPVGNETTIAQIPAVERADTAAEYVINPILMFPEPIAIKANTRLSVRVAGTRVNTTYNGSKIFFRENDREDTVFNNYHFVRVGDGMGCTEKLR